jgi:DNA adenine methylase
MQTYNHTSKSFLRWAGSKKKLLPILTKYWRPSFSRYVEPFVGSAQLFFSTDADKYLISDKNHELIEVYKQVQKNPHAVYLALKQFNNSKEDYYRIRTMKNEKLGVNQRVARFIYLNWLCFNGLYRTNNLGQFNVPYSGETTKNIYNWQLLRNASLKLKSAHIEEGDFELVIRNNLKRNDFVYLDPPYAVENVRIFNQYGNHTFGLNDLERLSQLLYFIDQKNSFFLVSYANCEEARRLFKDWKIKEVSVLRNIAGFATHRKISSEILVTNL